MEDPTPPTYPWGTRHDADGSFSDSVMPRDNSIADIAPWATVGSTEVRWSPPKFPPLCLPCTYSKIQLISPLSRMDNVETLESAVSRLRLDSAMAAAPSALVRVVLSEGIVGEAIVMLASLI